MPILFHTALVALHLIAVAVGLGSAFLADWVAMRLLFTTVVPPVAVLRLRDLSKAVTAGLLLLWCTGAVLVWYDSANNPAFLLNQKVWGKVAIVFALTFNAVVLHRAVLPLVAAQTGQALFGGAGLQKMAVCSFAASVSLVSWLFALVLGVARELNGVVTMVQVLTAYGAVLGAAWVGATVVLFLLQPRCRPGLVKAQSC